MSVFPGCGRLSSQHETKEDTMTSFAPILIAAFAACFPIAALLIFRRAITRAERAGHRFLVRAELLIGNAGPVSEERPTRFIWWVFFLLDVSIVLASEFPSVRRQQKDVFHHPYC